MAPFTPSWADNRSQTGRLRTPLASESGVAHGAQLESNSEGFQLEPLLPSVALALFTKIERL